MTTENFNIVVLSLFDQIKTRLAMVEAYVINKPEIANTPEFQNEFIKLKKMVNDSLVFLKKENC